MSTAEPSEDFARDVRELRKEIQALREVVNALFHAVFDDEDEDDTESPYPDDHIHTFDLT